ncbi:gluconate 2-dehydrogenase subunit 3 family protein [Hydrogenimonas sp.]
MNRREFIGTAGLAAAALCSAGPMEQHEHEEAMQTIFAVQRHFFPKGLLLPDADSFGAAIYTRRAMAHSSFDPDIRHALLEGARRLQQRCDTPFVSLSPQKKEQLLRGFEKDSFGAYWLSTLMNLTLEALLADPIYGGNRDEAGWKAFSLTPGKPRPKKRYCGV